MKLIRRNQYLQRLLDLQSTPDIKIITGIRRSGKSELMKAYIEHIQQSDPLANIIFIDFTDLEFENLKEYHQLYQYVELFYQEGKNNYLFIDEVQLCPSFELAVNSLHAKHKYDIYLTGSNAFLLSADLATLFTGRYIEIHVFPFSFKEYTLFFGDIKNILEVNSCRRKGNGQIDQRENLGYNEGPLNASPDTLRILRLG